MSVEKAKNFLIKTLYVLALALGVYVLFSYGIPLFMPFLLAFLVGLIVRPLSNFLHKKLKIPPKLSAVVLVTLVLALLVFLLLWAGSELISYLQSLFTRYNDRLVPFISDLFRTITATVSEWDPDLAELIGGALTSVINTVGTKIAEISVSAGTSTLAAAPLVLLQIMFFTVASYFVALDPGLIDRTVKNLAGPERYEKYITFKKTFGSTVGRILRSYGILFVITYCELMLGLLFLGVPNFNAIALAIATVDIVPVLGSGTVLLPWAAIELLQRNTGFGIGLLILYVCITAIRQFIEPRILGKQTGLHPVFTLIALYVGMRLFGILGMFGLPLLIAFLVALQREGVIKVASAKLQVTRVENETEPQNDNVTKKKNKEK
ncbi:MAG: sporulation integral membrane protein YtvI [Clostridiales bacterium]|nr:sporulation integral membrane protein YtvI [Clostridiales bacterium]